MTTEQQVATMLRWRETQALDQAPPPPRAAHLLALVQPWWENWPEQFRRLADRLGRISVTYAHAMADPVEARRAHPIAALIVRGNREEEAFASVLYLNVRDGRLRVRFQLNLPDRASDDAFEATFVPHEGVRPFCSAVAARSVDNEYSLEAEIPAELARDWLALKVTDIMPFRLILRTTFRP